MNGAAGNVRGQWPDSWRRPLPATWLREDILAAAGFLVFGALGLEASRSLGLLSPDLLGTRAQYAFLVCISLLVIGRRRFPATSLLVLTGMLVAIEHLVPSIMQILAVQALCVLLFYSVAAWAHPRSRGAVVLVLAGLAVVGRVLWGAAMVADALPAEPVGGVVPPVIAHAVYGIMFNVLVIAAAVAAGWISWSGARQRQLLATQAEALAEQVVERRKHAVFAERVRIARDLHDVVSHHVAGIAVQVGAIRRVARVDGSQFSDQLRDVEGAARVAVAELGAAVRNLREASGPGSEGQSRRDISGIRSLVEECADRGLEVRLDYVESRPGLLELVPSELGAALYRIAQEALSNIGRHSTATTAHLTIRAQHHVADPYVEIEVLDRGLPRPDSSGGGFGLVGIRERLVAFGGEGEIGQRVGGGYRVRVRFAFVPEPIADETVPGLAQKSA